MELYHKNIRYRLENLAVGFVLFLFAVLCVYPVLYVLFASFSDPMKLAQHTGLLWKPLEFTLEGYKVAASYQGIWKGYGNTILIVVSGVTVNMCLTVLAAYVLSKKELYLHRAMNLFVIFTMYFSGGLIPTYLVIRNLHMTNTIWAMMIPGALSFYNALIVRSYFSNSIPNDLQEAAELDGANPVQYLVKVVLPLSKPVLAVVCLYYAVGHWNDYYTALIYISDRNLVPLQTALREVLMSSASIANLLHNTDSNTAMLMQQRMELAQSLKYTSIIAGIIPMMIVYPFVQKYFVKGVMVGAIKG